MVGHERVLRYTTLYTFYMVDISGTKHEVQAYGIDLISEDSVILDLEGVKSVFPVLRWTYLGDLVDPSKFSSGPCIEISNHLEEEMNSHEED